MCGSILYPFSELVTIFQPYYTENAIFKQHLPLKGLKVDDILTMTKRRQYTG
jgi:hypothetical protein